MSFVFFEEILSKLLSLDYELFWKINQVQSSPLTRSFNWLVSSNTLWAVISVLLFIVSLYKGKQSLKTFFSILFVVILCDNFCYRILKPHFSRLRPCHRSSEVITYNNRCGGLDSFPSNHAANSSAALTTAFFFVSSKIKLLPFVPLVFLIGYSRVFSGVHFPMDILAGFIVGGLFGLLAGLLKGLIKQMWRRNHE